MADLTVGQFRIDFPELADTTKYPDGTVQFWLTVATNLVNTERWGVLTNQGIELAAAHFLVLAMRDQTIAAGGGTPGLITGPMSSKSVDGVSASYDVGAMTISDGGMWNMTSYGIRFLTLARLFGLGGIQISPMGGWGDNVTGVFAGGWPVF